jgi:hypothetical protein
MSDFIRPGEVLRSGVLYCEQARAESIRARCIAIVSYADRQPWSSLHQLSNRQVMAFLLKRSGMPRFFIGSFMRQDGAEIAASIRAVHDAMREPQIAEWLGRMLPLVPNFNDAEPKPGQAEFARV